MQSGEGGTTAPDLPPLDPGFLVIDDDEGVRRLVYSLVRRRFPRCDAAASLGEARRLLAQQPYDILFLDLTLPDGEGSRLLEDRELLPPSSLVVVITGLLQLDTAIQVIRRGAFDYIAKPFGLGEFQERLDKAVEEWRSRQRYLRHQRHLEKLVSVMTDQVAASSEQIEKTYDMAVAALGAALDLRDPETEEHCRRVSRNSLRLGQAMGLPPLALRNLRWSAYLHDIGKIGIPEAILSKSSSLNDAEMAMIREHPLLGYRLIRDIEFLQQATDVVLYHHERYDGSGYPYGLKGMEIPTAARIFAVIDAMDAMLYDRPYRRAMSFAKLVEELARHAGGHFDPGVVEAFLRFSECDWRQEELGIAEKGEPVSPSERAWTAGNSPRRL
jgi:putative nucleotidyltransferase with HDIG domain